MAVSTENAGFDDFLRIDIRAGRIIEAEPFPEARKPSIKMRVDFGPDIGVKKSSAQIAARYTPESLRGRLVMAVVNFPPRQIGKFMSEVLVLGVPDQGGNVVLLAPDSDVPLAEECSSGSPKLSRRFWRFRLRMFIQIRFMPLSPQGGSFEIIFFDDLTTGFYRCGHCSGNRRRYIDAGSRLGADLQDTHPETAECRFFPRLWTQITGLRSSGAGND